MPERERKLGEDVQLAVDDMDIAVAEPGSFDLDQDFIWPQFGDGNVSMTRGSL